MELTDLEKETTWQEDFEQTLLNGTKYSGSKKAEEKVISASSLTKEIYPLLLQYYLGNQEQTKYGANTTGSIYQLGLDSLLAEQEPERYKTAIRMKYMMENGWTISGELDILDTVKKVIIDGKLIGDFSFKKNLKNNPDEAYNLQVGSYRMLNRLTNTTGDQEGDNPVEYAGALHMVNKGGSATKDNLHKDLDLFMHDNDTIFNMFVEKTTKLQEYIDSGILPDQDSEDACNIFAFGKGKDGSVNRCKLYCDYRDVCPRYNNTKAEFIRAKNKIDEMVNHKPEKEKEEFDPSVKIKF